MAGYRFKDYQAGAEFVLERMRSAGLPASEVQTALVLGSGLGEYDARLRVQKRIPYGEIPHFPVSTNESHKGELILGKTRQGLPLLLLSGRVHCYEGYTMEQAAFYVRLLHLLGIKTLIITNAAGAVNPCFSPGELMLITDHIKLCADSPVAGPHLPQFGQRFFDMSGAYTPALQALAEQCARRRGILLRRGVYQYFAGPQYETPAEVRAAALLGADAVGMSTVPEVIAAAGCGMEVLGISLLTNMAAGITGETLSDREVVMTAKRAGSGFGDLMDEILEAIRLREDMTR